MSEEQNSRVQHLQERLQPLSPSGQIPGLGDGSYFANSDLGEPGAYDLDLGSFTQGDDYFPDSNAQNNGTGPGDVTLPDLSYTLPDPADMEGGTGFDSNNADPFGFDGANDNLNVGDAGGRIESVSSNATSPAATVEEVEDETRSRRSPKRRKK